MAHDTFSERRDACGINKGLFSPGRFLLSALEALVPPLMPPNTVEQIFLFRNCLSHKLSLSSQHSGAGTSERTGGNLMSVPG